jgi:hypothetical protein
MVAGQIVGGGFRRKTWNKMRDDACQVAGKAFLLKANRAENRHERIEGKRHKIGEKPATFGICRG